MDPEWENNEAAKHAMILCAGVPTIRESDQHLLETGLLRGGG